MGAWDLPAQETYPDELRERAVRLVIHIREERGSSYGVVLDAARLLGIDSPFGSRSRRCQ